MRAFNLLPWREKQQQERKRNTIRLIVAVLILAAIILGFYRYTLNLEVEKRAQQNQALEHKKQLLDEKVKAVNELKKQNQSLFERAKITQNALHNRKLTIEIFQAMSRTIPEGVYLTGIERQGHTIELRGKAQSDALVSRTVNQLKTLAWAKDVVLKQITTDEKESHFNKHFVIALQQATPSVSG